MDAQQKWRKELGYGIARPSYIRQASEGSPIVIPFDGLSKRHVGWLHAALRAALLDRMAHFDMTDGRAYVHLNPYGFDIGRALSIVHNLVWPMKTGVLATLYGDSRNSREVRWEVGPVMARFSPNPQWTDEVAQWHSTLRLEGLKLSYSGHNKVVGSVVHDVHAMTRADNIVGLFCDRFTCHPVRTLQTIAPL